MIKEMIHELNRAMHENEISFDCARNLLKQLYKLTGKEYDIIHRRVVIMTENGTFLDAYVNS